MTPLIEPQFRWVLEHLRVPQNVGPSTIMLMGDGPLHWTEWRDALFAQGRDVYFPDQYHATLLVGRRNWSKALILDLVEARQGLKVRIVSQEMMLAWLTTPSTTLQIGFASCGATILSTGSSTVWMATARASIGHR